MISKSATIGECLDSGFEIFVYCASSSHCNHGRKIDLEAMAAEYGRDHGALHADLIKLPWKCEKCGGRKVSFRYQPGGIQYARKDGPEGRKVLTRTCPSETTKNPATEAAGRDEV